MNGGLVKRVVSGDFVVGFAGAISADPAASGKMTMTSGTLDLSSGGNLYVGFGDGSSTVNGSGEMNLSGDAKVLASSVGVGADTGSKTVSTGLLTLKDNAQLTYSGTFTIGGASVGVAAGNGELDMTGGVITGSGGNFVIASGNNTSGKVTVTSGTINTSTSTSSAVYVGNGGATAEMYLQGDAVFNAGNNKMYIGATATGARLTTGLLQIEDNASLTVSDLTLGAHGGGTGNGTVNLNGGVLATNFVTKDNSALSVTTFNFNGGTLQARSAQANFIGLASKVQEGGAKIDSNGFDVTVSQALQSDAVNDGGVTKLGSGKLTLNAANTYNGQTLVQSGTLALGSAGTLGTSKSLQVSQGAFFDASAKGTYAYNSGMTISGGGTVIGNTLIGAGQTVSAGGTIAAPGDRVGKLTFNGNLGWNTGAAYNWNISDATGGSGTGWDLISVTGGLNFSTGVSDVFTLNISGSSLANFNLDSDYQWDILDAASIAGFDATKFVLNIASFNTAGGAFSIGTTGANNENLTLFYHAVPEPAHLALLGLGGAALLLRRRRG